MNNDLISRSALKEEIQKELDKADLSEYESCICVTSIYDRLIDNAPTIEPFERIGLICEENCGFRPKGEWIYHKGDGYFLPTMECSQCHESDLLGDLTPKLYKDYYKFCFRCGADMRKEDKK